MRTASKSSVSALAAAAWLLASVATASGRAPSLTLRTPCHVGPATTIASGHTGPGYDGREVPLAAEAIYDLAPATVSSPWSASLDGKFQWIPTEILKVLDGFQFDRFDLRTGDYAVFADGTRRSTRDRSIQ